MQVFPNYRSRCVSAMLLERIDSYPIRLLPLAELERSNPSPLRKSCWKNLFQWKLKAYPIWKLEWGYNDAVWWKRSIRRATYHMRVFNMAYVVTCDSERMPFPVRLGLHGVYRILGISVLECCSSSLFFTVCWDKRYI